MDFSKAEISSLTIEVIVKVGGKTFKGKIDNNELFCADLMRGIRNGKDPVDVIAFLADEGTRHLGIPHGSNPISEMNRIGK